MRKEFPRLWCWEETPAGEVAEVGTGVTGLKPGDRVIINPKISCGHCSYCLTGKDDLCSHSTMLGSQADGSYAEYVTVPQENAIPIADTVTYDEAAAVPTTYLPVWTW